MATVAERLQALERDMAQVKDFLITLRNRFETLKDKLADQEIQVALAQEVEKRKARRRR